MGERVSEDLSVIWPVFHRGACVWRIKGYRDSFFVSEHVSEELRVIWPVFHRGTCVWRVSRMVHHTDHSKCTGHMFVYLPWPYIHLYVRPLKGRDPSVPYIKPHNLTPDDIKGTNKYPHSQVPPCWKNQLDCFKVAPLYSIFCANLFQGFWLFSIY